MSETAAINKDIDRCKSLIKNWDKLENIDFNFGEVQIDAFFVDSQPNEMYEKWEVSLVTTIPTQTDSDGRDIYSVRWGFKDLWGNLAFCSLQGHYFTGELHLRYIDYDDFAIVGFSVLREDGTHIFKFDQPDEVSVLSVEKKGHQTLQEVYPEDY